VKERATLARFRVKRPGAVVLFSAIMTAADGISLVELLRYRGLCRFSIHE
jgi:hypothetical protein